MLFLYIDPLKQGLKHNYYLDGQYATWVFIHRSIKTRIETILYCLLLLVAEIVFIHRSIKTRIETNNL